MAISVGGMSTINVQIGTHVVLEGLSAADLSGQRGVVADVLPAKGRVVVTTEGPDAKQLKIKPRNLRVEALPPWTPVTPPAGAQGGARRGADLAMYQRELMDGKLPFIRSLAARSYKLKSNAMLCRFTKGRAACANASVSPL